MVVFLTLITHSVTTLRHTVDFNAQLILFSELERVGGGKRLLRFGLCLAHQQKAFSALRQAVECMKQMLSD